MKNQFNIMVLFFCFSKNLSAGDAPKIFVEYRPQKINVQNRMYINGRRPGDCTNCFGRELLECMKKDPLSTPEKIHQLKTELAEYYKTDVFLKCKTMGSIIKTSLKEMIRRNKQHV